MYDFASEIYEIWGESTISIFLEYLLRFRTLPHNNTQAMLKLCRSRSNIAAMTLENKHCDLSNNQIFTLLSIVNPFVDNMSSKSLIKVFNMLNAQSLNEMERNDLSDFFLPAIFRSKQHFPDEIVSFAVNNTHERLAKLIYPEDKWYKLQSLLPDASWLNQWDKCKRVRKAIKKKGYRIKEIDEYNDNELDIHLL